MRCVFLFLFLVPGAIAEEIRLPEVTVVGEDGISRFEHSPHSRELTGARLRRKRQSTLGETLGRELGVSSNFFGPASSRPVVRGLDGDRVRLLENGLGILDASAASPDHAVAIDPLAVEKFEVLQGPSALLYGPNVIGGVINSVVPRIPQGSFDTNGGRAEARGSSVDRGRSLGLVYNANVNSRFAYHLEGTARGVDNYHAPTGEVLNSFQRNLQGGVGASYFFAEGFAGLAVSNFESTYGSVAEPDVILKMRRQRYDMDMGVRMDGFFKSVRLQDSYSVYSHDEVESGVVGTTFKNQGNEARVEFSQRPWGDWTGEIGAQSSVFDFAALGSEAFMPPTRNAIHAVFIHEEVRLGAWTPSVAARIEHSQVQSENSVKFGGGRGVLQNGFSAAMGTKFSWDAQTAFSLSASLTERAANYQELFAGGVHAATGQFIQGNTGLGKETSKGLEFSMERKSGWGAYKLNLFYQDFGNFIALSPTGSVDPGSSLPIYDYQGVPAHLYGAEWDWRVPLPRGLSRHGLWELEFKLDFVKARDLRNNTSLPRMPPLRETLALLYTHDQFQADVEIQRSERQTDLAAFETSTADFILVNAGAEMPVRWSQGLFQVFGRVNNIFDTEARLSTSPLKDRAPLPGRNLVVGLRAEF